MISHRTMSLVELGTVLDWAADEGWNPGLDDAEAFRAVDPDGFVIALDGETPAAAISVVNHSPGFAFLGLYLCKPQYRGRGIGLGVWRTAIAHAGNRTIGLDGVPDQQENYARSGFAHAGATIRYSGRVPGRVDPAVRRAEEADIQTLVVLEAAASGWAKETYMSTWFSPTDTRITYVLEAESRIAGCVTVRRCRAGAKIGPLVAESPGVAERLIAHAAAVFDTGIMIDVPSTSAPLDTLCQRFGLTPCFRTARMYRGDTSRPASFLYAVTTLELG